MNILRFRFPKWWSEERRKMAKTILGTTGASSFECLLKEIPYSVSTTDRRNFSKENELKETLNTLLKKGRMKAEVMLTNQASPYTLFYNPRRSKP